MEDNDLFLYHSQYHGCWCPGSTRRTGINSHDTDLTHKQLEMHERTLSTVPTDGLVLKHQAISDHSADLRFIVLGKFHTEMLQL